MATNVDATSRSIDTATPVDGSLVDRLTFRPYRGPEDHAEMNRVANRVRAAAGNPSNGSVAEMDAFYRGLDAAALPADCVIVELDGVVVAYGRASWEELSAGDAEIGAFMNVDPAQAGRGIEERLTEHALRRAAALVRERGTERASFLRMWIGDQAVHELRAAEAAGLRRVRAGATLIRPSVEDIPEVALPDGYEIRPIAADDEAMIRQVWDADGRAFAETWGHELPTEQAFRAWRSDPTFNPPLWRVAFHGDDIAGQILNYLAEPEADGSRIGWTEAISVQPEHRRRGLARALLAASLRSVRDAGATKAALGVDSHNPNQAQVLYESMGYRVVSVAYTYELGPFEPGSAGPVAAEVRS
jgi:ribosomal protein S18 acetylase RimI-like enzyme